MTTPVSNEEQLKKMKTDPGFIAAGPVPIVEPEVDIHRPGKADAEEVLKAAILPLRGLRPSSHRIYAASNT